jgi:CDP-paratose 2-epimerase
VTNGFLLVSGSHGLIGSEVVRQAVQREFKVVGIDNNMRTYFFGADGATDRTARELIDLGPDVYRFFDLDIRDVDGTRKLFADFAGQLAGIIHTAAQPSHDWAAREPRTDFSINAMGTLNLLELWREFAPNVPFVFTSTNKVYGDRPNSLPFRELSTRYDLHQDHPYFEGIDESMSIDMTMHSIFGASKVSADVMVQEYGRYFGLHTACFRGGTLTGSGHAAAELHGFLAYLVRCTLEGRPYRIIGYGGKQVRDVIHASDLVSALFAFLEAPKVARVYNIGGGRQNNCSVLEAIALVEEITGRSLKISFDDTARLGDHQWWISSNRTFENDFPEWSQRMTLPGIVEEIVTGMSERSH